MEAVEGVSVGLRGGSLERRTREQQETTLEPLQRERVELASSGDAELVEESRLLQTDRQRNERSTEREQSSFAEDDSSQSSSGSPTRDARRKPLSSILRLSGRGGASLAAKGSSDDSSRSSQKRRKPLRFLLAKSQDRSQEPNPARGDSSIAVGANPGSQSPRRQDAPRGRPKGSRIRRTSSSHEAFTRLNSDSKRMLLRSSSERLYRPQVSRGERASALQSGTRNGTGRGYQTSRRWENDDYAPPEPQGEGELDSFFRFMDECTRAAWRVVQGIPQAISQLPQLTMNILQQLIPALKRPNVPAITAPPAE